MTAILSFAPSLVAVPETVAVRKVDLALDTRSSVSTRSGRGGTSASGRDAGLVD